MRVLPGLTIVSLVVFSSACTTPGLNYSARLMPDNFATTEHRDVAVEHFAGPAGPWYAGQFEAMLFDTEFDNAPWFNVMAPRPTELSPAPSGVYAGEISVTDHDWDERYRTVSKCIEWDGLFDCETRVDVEEICYSEEVEVSVEPHLTNLATGEIVYSNVYTGRAHEEECFETGIYDGAFNKKIKRKRHSHSLSHIDIATGFRGFSAPMHLIREALIDTLRPIRVDIAPRNARVRANFLTAALDPVAAADVRFQQALDLARDEPATSCALWADLAAEYTAAPAVLYNTGVCAEAAHKFADAQGRYAEASALMPSFGEAGEKAYAKALKSLNKLSDQRYGLEAIKDLTGERIDIAPDTTS